MKKILCWMGIHRWGVGARCVRCGAPDVFWNNRRAATRITAGLACVFLVGCGDDGVRTAYVDRSIYRDTYLSCLAAIPKPPAQTHYSDLDEAMGKCDEFALQVATQPQDCPTCTPRKVRY